MSPPLSDSTTLHRAFKKFDIDQSGEVNSSELKELLASLGVKRSDEQVAELLKAVDQDGSGSLSFDEFSSLFETARLKQVFDDIDEDGSGHLDVHELSLALRKLGYRLDQRKCEELLAKIDADNDNTVTFDEFVQFFQFVPLASLNSIAAHLIGDIPLDTGTDLAPPIPSKSLPVWECLLVGGLSGITSRTLTAPLERVKIQAQTVGIRSILGELRRLVQAEGWQGLWAGNGANCIRVFPFAGIVMLSYTRLVKLLPCDDEPVWRCVAGGLAGAIGTLLTYPIDVVRTKLTVDGARFQHSISACARSIVSKHGVAGLYRGLSPTLCAVMPFLAIQQSTHDVCKRIALDTGFEPSVPVFLGASMAAGAFAQTVVYPLDLIRRRVQLGHSASASVVADMTWLAGLRDVIRQGGVRNAFAGITPTYFKVIPSVMIAKTMADALVAVIK